VRCSKGPKGKRDGGAQYEDSRSQRGCWGAHGERGMVLLLGEMNFTECGGCQGMPFGPLKTPRRVSQHRRRLAGTSSPHTPTHPTLLNVLSLAIGALVMPN